MANITHECMLAIELVPGSDELGVGHSIVDFATTFSRNVRILSAPDHQHFGFDLSGTIESAVVTAFAKGALMKVRAIEASARSDFGLSDTGAEAEVPTKANSEGSDFARRGFMIL